MRINNTGYLIPCIKDPFPSVAIWAGLFAGIDALQGHPINGMLVKRWGIYTVGFWSYHALICPMEVIQGRQSALHNAASAGTLGYLGVSRGIVGIPFVNPYQAMYFRYPALLGAAVYGGLFGCLAFFLEGKPI